MSPITPIGRFLAALTCLAALLLTGCGAPEPGLRIAAHVWPGYEFLFLARGEGWLDETRVRLVETPSASDSMHALRTGLVDGAALTLDEVLRLRADGIPLTIVLVFDTSLGADVLLAAPTVGSLAGLRGRTIGAEETALGALMAVEVLEAAGLDASDVVLVPLTIDRHESVWRRGEVDALITYEPVARRIEALGAVRLFDSRRIPNTILDVLAIRSDRLSDRSEAIRMVIAAHFRAYEHFRQNPQDAAHRIAARMKISPAEVIASYGGLRVPTLRDNLGLLGENSSVADTARRLSSLMVARRFLPREDQLQGLLTADYLPAE